MIALMSRKSVILAQLSGSRAIIRPINTIVKYETQKKPGNIQRFFQSHSKLSSPSKSVLLDTSEDIHWFYYNRLFLNAGILGKFSPTSLFTPSSDRIKQLIRSHQPNATVLDVNVRPSEGGAFVTLKGDLHTIKTAASVGFSTRWMLINHRSRGFVVRGHPWITDIPHMLSSQLSVQPNIPDEECYELLRPYGRIVKIKDGAVRFFSAQDAATAAFCAHRSVIMDPLTNKPVTVRLSLVDLPSLLVRWQNWAGSHPKVVIPILFAVLFAAAYAIFEPMREFSIGLKVKGTFSTVEDCVEWAKQKSQQLIRVDKLVLGIDDAIIDTEPKHLSWNSTAASAKVLQEYIDEGSPTFIVVNGPKGSGKIAIVDAALQAVHPNSRANHPYVLKIDCAKLLASSSDQKLANLATSLGYWPMFLWTNKLLRAAELGIQGLTGQNAGLTETTDQQAERMLSTAIRAVRRVALKNKPANDKSSESSYLETHPQELPVVLITNYTSSDSGMVNLITTWASELIKQQIARPVLVTEEVAFDKKLGIHLPNKVFKVVRVEDAAPEAAKEYIMRKFANQATTESAKTALASFERLPTSFLEPLGGRYSDLQSFGRRLLNGEMPEHALDSLVHSAALETSQLFLSDHHKWSVEQAWTLVKCLANPNAEGFLSVPGVIATQSAFASGDFESSLEALEQSGLVTLRSNGGRITGVKASKPLYQAAFSELTSDPLISAVMAKKVAQFQISKETAKIKAAEEELVTLASALHAKNVREVKERQEYVAAQLGASQQKVLRYQSDFAQSIATLAQFDWFTPQTDVPRKTSNGGIWSRSSLSSRFE